MDKLAIDSRFLADVAKAVAFLKDVGCTEVYVFGSAVTGKSTAHSDLDLAVRGIPADKFFQVYGELMFLLDHPVDLVDLQLQAKFGDVLLKSGEMLRVA